MRIRLPCLLSGLAKLLACLGLARRQRKTRVFAQHCTWICSGRVSSLSSAMQGNAKGCKRHALCWLSQGVRTRFPRPAWSDSVRIEEHPMIQAHPAKTYDVPEPANDQLEGYSKDPKMQKLYFGSLESLLGRFWHPCRRNRLAVYTARWSLASDPDTKRTNKLETDCTWKLTWKVLAFVLLPYLALEFLSKLWIWRLSNPTQAKNRATAQASWQDTSFGRPDGCIVSSW